MFDRVLVANRGEIAGRIARAALTLGVDSVGVYAPVDAMSLHTRLVGQARELPGTDDPVAAYLDIDALLDVARETGCDALHPGYGFLAESSELARRAAEAGVRFIGPGPDVLALFGDKVRARAFAAELGVPVVPGSSEALGDVAAARALAGELGYPVMLKASAGGGGRGMRRVEVEAELAQAFERCASEAAAAFGDGALFLERSIERARHIEVQVLGDAQGNVVHLRERDCSVQLRHQKLIEVAPAPMLEATLLERILGDAVRLARAARFENAGTMEFLVLPETGEHFFIECNPRIQVEHTVTEQVLGLDLVAAQFRIAAGASLAGIGLDGQAQVGTPRGFAVQARVVTQGTGVISAYREPGGAGIRVDGNGYAGYEPPPQFDPLLAKVIGSAATYEAAVTLTRRALEEFHVGGVPTNLAQLESLLDHPAVRGGDARTSLTSEFPELLGAGARSRAGAALTLLEQRARGLGGPRTAGAQRPAPGLDVGPGQRGVPAPMAGRVLRVDVAAGDEVAAGATLLVVSAMKMEALVCAPCAGRVAAVLPLNEGDTVAPGQVLVSILPAAAEVATPADGQRSADGQPTDGWQEVLDEVADLKALAAARLAPESVDPGVVRQRSRGKLTCRERLELLLDPGSFREVGSIAGFATYDGEGGIEAFTPANSVGGWGSIEGRMAVACADDFTSRGGHADGAIGAKSTYLDRLSIELKVPSLRLLDGSSGGGSVAAMVPEQKREGESRAKESSGAIKAGRPRVAGGGGSFLPGHLGSTMYAEQLCTVPVVNLLLGSVVGIGAAKAVLGHFSVMVRDIAQLFVAGPPVVSHAMGYDISKEELGGWHVHCTNGSVDNLAETEADAMAQARRFLSYLPASVYEAPPVRSLDAGDSPDRQEDELAGIVPRQRTATFDVRRVIELLADHGSFFEIGALWGADQVVGLARFDGHPVGVIASDSRHENGGALTADGCDKLKRHLDLCDLFHLPVLNLVDNPGFAVGLEHELTGTIRRGGEWMVAFAQVQIPVFTVLMRRSFGVAGNNYATPRSRPGVRVVWPAADVGGIPPEGGIEAAYKRQLAEAEDPAALRAELAARIESARGPTGPLNRFQMEEMIDPRDTRRYICEWIPTAYRVVSQPGRLQPRALQFRP